VLVSKGRLVLAPVRATGPPYRLPSRINWSVPVGVGVTGEMAATTVIPAPCVTVEEFMAIVVVVGRVPGLRVNEEAAETED
jgi:hypothetical protein